MILFKRAADLTHYLDKQREQGKKTGFVPTMGALHEGHIDLLRACKEGSDLSIVSIFVNPTQFNDPKDFEKYPITLETDIEKLETAGCDVLFVPSVIEMYPGGTRSETQYDLGYLETILEGKYRPGHFQGVCMVVHRLLEIVQPADLYMGQKDYQQCMVITRLLELTGMQGNVHLNVVPTRREPGGLAMSSRNMRLSADQKQHAAKIHETLSLVKGKLQPGPLATIKTQARQSLQQNGFNVDYLEIARANNLAIVDDWNGEDKLVGLVAAYSGDVRLIDNLLLN